jgi:hypothetical protein
VGKQLGVAPAEGGPARPGIAEGSRVQLTAEASRILSTIDRPVYRLEELLHGLRPGDPQQALERGEEVGRELVDWGRSTPAS